MQHAEVVARLGLVVSAEPCAELHQSRVLAGVRRSLGHVADDLVGDAQVDVQGTRQLWCPVVG